MYRTKCLLLQILAPDQCILATQVLQDVRCEMHTFAILGFYINIPKLMRICPESARSPKKRSTNQEGNRSHSKDTFMSPLQAPLTIQIGASCFQKTVLSLPKTVPRPFDTAKMMPETFQKRLLAATSKNLAPLPIKIESSSLHESI